MCRSYGADHSFGAFGYINIWSLRDQEIRSGGPLQILPIIHGRDGRAT